MNLRLRVTSAIHWQPANLNLKLTIGWAVLLPPRPRQRRPPPQQQSWDYPIKVTRRAGMPVRSRLSDVALWEFKIRSSLTVRPYLRVFLAGSTLSASQRESNLFGENELGLRTSLRNSDMVPVLHYNDSDDWTDVTA